MHRSIFLWSAISGILAVAIGAFGSHALRKYLPPEDIAIYKTGVEYHFYHTLALLGTGILYKHYHKPLLALAALAFGVGIIFFPFSLYLLTITKISSGGEEKWLGAVTPFGGICFILGWLFLAIHFFQKNK
ncbi:MAG: DUF423 domain-containing protein [Dinghuibacter sp.]|nr:DUF423 domain-containing protein [Dinghuibacter sp.]